MAGSDRERARILQNARRIRDDIEQGFLDCAHWNRTHPDEEPIDFDPDSSMRRLADGLTRQLAEDTGSGPIPPIGGWLNPVFGRSSETPQ